MKRLILVLLLAAVLAGGVARAIHAPVQQQAGVEYDEDG